MTTDDFRCEECGHMVDTPQHARGCMAGIGPDVQRVLTQGEFARLERQAERLAEALRRVGVVPGRNPDGVNDDAEKAEQTMVEALGAVARLERENAELRASGRLTADEWHGVKFWLKHQRDDVRRTFTGATLDDFERIYERVANLRPAEG